jgi:hypothetical protein
LHAGAAGAAGRGAVFHRRQWPARHRPALELGDGWLPNAADAPGLAKGLAAMEAAMARERGITRLRLAVSLPGRIRLATPSARGPPTAAGRP